MQQKFENDDFSIMNEQTDKKIERCIDFLFRTIFDVNKIDQAVYLNFVEKVKIKYNGNPYHNYNHAIDATMTLHYLINNLEQNVAKLFDYNDKLIMIIAMMCHDLGHFGKTGKYIKETCLPITLETKCFLSDEFIRVYGFYGFSSDSPLEEFHWTLANEIINSTRLLDCFDNKLEMLDTIKQIILATDPATLNKFLESDEISKVQIMKLLVKSADIGSCLKSFDVHKNWGLNLKEEFEAQGDEMKLRGYEILSMFDRNSKKYFHDQLMFFQYYANPLYKKLGGIVNIKCLDNAIKNFEIWKSLNDGK